MTLTLTVRTASWRAHVARVASSVDGLVPVVKGNGYGFGRVALAEIAAEFSDTVAVGTVRELDGLPDDLDAMVLTPTLVAPPSSDPVLTVGHLAHVDCLDGWGGRVIVKLESSMHRYGRGIELVDVARSRGLEVIGVSIHLPLVGSSGEHADEVRTLIADVDAGLPVWLSHLDPTTYASLPATHTYRLRLGTSLWHGDKSTLRLGADVLDARPVRAGQRAGYRQEPIDADGHLVMIGAGTASGVAALPDGRSPFHFERRRLRLHEDPHMHTSMVFVPDGDPVPDIGASVDVQRPLTMTTVDTVDWI